MNQAYPPPAREENTWMILNALKTMNNTYLENNRHLWDHWTRLHATCESDYADLLARFRAGETTLQDVELAEVGDVSNKSLLHLQCHFGLDTLSWARRGATATGVDFSEQAIALARSLSAELGIDAQFVCSDIYDLPQVLDGQFDIVYTSYGVLPWLPDLDRWAGIVAHYLEPGGTFYIVEGHPARRILLPRRVDDTGKPVEHGYFHRAAPVQVEERGSYARPDVDAVHTAYYWTHSLGQVVTTLCTAGLRLEFLHEFPKTVENCCAYQETAAGQYEPYLCRDVTIPHQFSIRATRPAQATDLLECVAFMLVQDGKVLAEKRKLTKEDEPGAVAIPGGHVERGEHLEETLRRELEEELGITPGTTKYVCSLLHRSHTLLQIHYYAVELWEGEIQANEAESLLWIPFDELERFDIGVDRVAIGEYLRVYMREA